MLHDEIELPQWFYIVGTMITGYTVFWTLWPGYISYISSDLRIAIESTMMGFLTQIPLYLIILTEEDEVKLLNPNIGAASLATALIVYTLVGINRVLHIF